MSKLNNHEQELEVLGLRLPATACRKSSTTSPSEEGLAQRNQIKKGLFRETETRKRRNDHAVLS